MLKSFLSDSVIWPISDHRATVLFLAGTNSKYFWQYRTTPLTQEASPKGAKDILFSSIYWILQTEIRDVTLVRVLTLSQLLTLFPGSHLQALSGV